MGDSFLSFFSLSTSRLDRKRKRDLGIGGKGLRRKERGRERNEGVARAREGPPPLPRPYIPDFPQLSPCSGRSRATILSSTSGSSPSGCLADLDPVTRISAGRTSRLERARDYVQRIFKRGLILDRQLNLTLLCFVFVTQSPKRNASETFLARVLEN